MVKGSTPAKGRSNQEGRDTQIAESTEEKLEPQMPDSSCPWHSINIINLNIEYPRISGLQAQRNNSKL